MIEWALRAARLLQYAAVLSLVGAALFTGARGANLSTPSEPASPKQLRQLLLVAALVGLLGTAAWLAVEAIALTGRWTDWPTLILYTRFGRSAAVRAGLLTAAAVCLALGEQRVPKPSVGWLAVAALVCFVWSGHGAMGEGLARWLHVGCDAAHLLAAALWIGALAALTAQALRCAPDDLPEARSLARRLVHFSRIGPAIVAVLVATGIANCTFVLGPHPWHALLGSPYGGVLFAKLALFALMLLLAAINRLRLTPAVQIATAGTLQVPLHGPTLRWLRSSLLAESSLALLVLAAVAVLGTLAPPASG